MCQALPHYPCPSPSPSHPSAPPPPLSDGPAGLHRYKLRLLFDAVPMRWDWPADVNYHEAQAYATWRTRQDGSLLAYRLITEAEHMCIRNGVDRADAPRLAVSKGGKAAAAAGGAPKQVINLTASAGSVAVSVNGHAVNGHAGVDPELDAEVVNRDVAMAVSGVNAAKVAGFNFQLAHGSACPVTALPPSSGGFHDTLGNVWEWGEDHFAAFPGFKVHPYYDDFSAPCFAGLHHMVGGVWREQQAASGDELWCTASSPSSYGAMGCLCLLPLHGHAQVVCCLWGGR